MKPTQKQFFRTRAASCSRFPSVTCKLGALLTGGRQLQSSGFLTPAAQGGVIGWIRSGAIGFLGVLVEAGAACAPSAPAGDDYRTLSSEAGPTEQVIGHAGGVAPAEKAIVTSTEDKNGQEISLVMGDSLEVRLASQPGTGYGWQLAGPLPAVLRLVEKALDLGGGGQAPNAPGASATAVLRFASVEAGTGELRLVYARPWEKESAPKKTYTLHIRVRSGTSQHSERLTASEMEVL
jgi:inhibitor of cysteine peptidase